MTRLSVIVPDYVHGLLKEISNRHHWNTTNLVRIGIPVLYKILEAQKQGYKIVIRDVDGKSDIDKIEIPR